MQRTVRRALMTAWNMALAARLRKPLDLLMFLPTLLAQ
jgi:hypothetical protein